MPNLTTIFIGGGYRGEFKKCVRKNLKMDLKIVKRTDDTTKWQIQPIKWIIERTFAWLLYFRRLVLNYKRTAESAISYIHSSMICLMVKNIN